jgi:serine/threonine protein kinase
MVWQHDYVKVLDFGLFKSPEGSGTKQLTPPTPPPTPAFMPPEMAAG